jgi:hypothetical protein
VPCTYYQIAQVPNFKFAPGWLNLNLEKRRGRLKCRIFALIPLAVFYVRRELDNDLGAREGFAAAEEFLSIQNMEFREFFDTSNF